MFVNQEHIQNFIQQPHTKIPSISVKKIILDHFKDAGNWKFCDSSFDGFYTSFTSHSPRCDKFPIVHVFSL